jgi:hypothetical protein
MGLWDWLMFGIAIFTNPAPKPPCVPKYNDDGGYLHNCD